jgi:hypothetical protein
MCKSPTAYYHLFREIESSNNFVITVGWHGFESLPLSDLHRGKYKMKPSRNDSDRFSKSLEPYRFLN